MVTVAHNFFKLGRKAQSIISGSVWLEKTVCSIGLPNLFSSVENHCLIPTKFCLSVLWCCDNEDWCPQGVCPKFPDVPFLRWELLPLVCSSSKPVDMNRRIRIGLLYIPIMLGMYVSFYAGRIVMVMVIEGGYLSFIYNFLYKRWTINRVHVVIERAITVIFKITIEISTTRVGGGGGSLLILQKIKDKGKILSAWMKPKRRSSSFTNKLLPNVGSVLPGRLVLLKI